MTDDQPPPTAHMWNTMNTLWRALIITAALAAVVIVVGIIIVLAVTGGR